MKKSILQLLMSILAVNALAGPIIGADSLSGTQSVGLVLSGGGAKGIAHIGVIQALEDNDIPIDYVAGTSMGAIVGSLYACGYTPAEMLTLIQSEAFAHWSTGVIDEKLTYYFLKDDPLPTMFNLNFGDSDSTLFKSVVPSSLINPLPMNFAFMELYAPYTAQCGGDFDRLFVPFRSVCSDMIHKRKIVSSHGSLGDAVRASMSFPLVFHPVQRDGALLYDGGIYDNFPVDVMRDTFAPQIMIGVDVASADSPDPTHNIVSQLETMIIHNSGSRLPEEQGIKIRLHLEKFGLLDFQKAQQIYQIGYDRAIGMIDSIKNRIHARIPAEARRLRRAVFKSQTPYLRFDSVTVTGGNASQNSYLKSLFTLNDDDTFGIARARDGYYRAITPGKFKNLEPEAVYKDTSGLFDLNLKSTLKDNVFFGAGGYLSTATNSMLFLTGGYKTLSFRSLDLRMNGWVGQSYLAAEASAHIRLLRSAPSGMQVRLVASRQKYFARDRMFFQTSEPTAVVRNEYFGNVGYGVAVGRRGKAGLDVGYGHIDSKAYLSTLGMGDRGRDDLSQNLAVVHASYEYNTLNDSWAATAGARYKVNLTGTLGQAYFGPNSEAVPKQRYHRAWLQAEFSADNYWMISPRFSFGTEVAALFSTRKLFPCFTASMLDAPAYLPSPSYSNIFTTDFRANSYGVVGVKPIWNVSSMFQVRGCASMFAALRPILCNDDGSARYGDYLSRLRFFGQVEGVVTLPFANITFYTHYANIRSHRWNFGFTFGYFLQAPKLTD